MKDKALSGHLLGEMIGGFSSTPEDNATFNSRKDDTEK